jgi:hypothetical protein
VTRDFEHDPTGRISAPAWDRTAAEMRHRERDEAVHLLSTRGYCLLWTATVGVRTVTAPASGTGYDVDAGLRDWDALVSQRLRRKD